MIQKLSIITLILTVCCFTLSCKKAKLIQGTSNVAQPVLIGGYKKSDMHFKVQIGAFERPLAPEDPFFEGVVGEEVRIDLSPNGNLHRYSLGTFKDYNEADAYEKKLKASSYDQAFVVAFGDDNQRIELPMQEILRLYNMAAD